MRLAPRVSPRLSLSASLSTYLSLLILPPALLFTYLYSHPIHSPQPSAAVAAEAARHPCRCLLLHLPVASEALPTLHAARSNPKRATATASAHSPTQLAPGHSLCARRDPVSWILPLAPSELVCLPTDRTHAVERGRSKRAGRKCSSTFSWPWSEPWPPASGRGLHCCHAFALPSFGGSSSSFQSRLTQPCVARLLRLPHILEHFSNVCTTAASGRHTANDP